jgi:hypothetical protein
MTAATALRRAATANGDIIQFQPSCGSDFINKDFGSGILSLDN